MSKSSNTVIFHIDVNSAYLSWEAVHRLQHGSELDIREIPSAIGGDPVERRGIILARSIPAKKYNIKTGETVYSAMQKCPKLAIYPPRYDLYIKCSTAMGELLKEYSPSVERFSIDEFFIDYTNMEKHFGSPVEGANTIRKRIQNELGFTVNIGVSSNKLLSKMASDFSKPNKVHTLFPDEISDKLWPLPVRDLFMVGRATARKLNKLGISTIGDLACYDPEILKRHLKSHGILVWNFANGIENSPVLDRPDDIKSIGNSSTISFDVKDKKTAHMILLSLTEMVGMRLRSENYRAGLVSISIRTNEFFSYSRQRKLDYNTDSTNFIYETAVSLFDEIWKGEPLRQFGVRVSDLHSNKATQLSIFEPKEWLKQEKLDIAIDKIRSKHGTDKIIRAVFLDSEIKPLLGGVSDDDYPGMKNNL
ncbi:MAG TPA: DNA polymerase IV [Thermoanaerobacterales bacterium]|nr:DNA polymerase IV [Thermoanaerobacterales bacterium]